MGAGNRESADGAMAPVNLAREARFGLGDLEVSPATREVIRAGERQILQPRTMQVLVALARQRGQVVARDTLVATCWGGLIVSDDSINRCILAIRHLATVSGAFSITTVPRVGYRLDESTDAVSLARSAPSRLSPLRARLLGRDTELAELHQVLGDALGGRGSLVLLTGEPGIGKTRLAEEVAAEGARRGALVLTGRCYETAGAPPYNPFVEMVEETVRLLPAPTLREALGADAPEVAKISPELRKTFDDIPLPIELPREQGRRYLFNAFRDFLERMARGRPLVLLFDDLHWADDATLGLLRHVVDRLVDMPVLIIGTHRNAESDVAGRFTDWWNDIHRQRLGQRLVLHPLAEEASVALIGALASHRVPETLSASIYRTTEGNPFYIEEVVRHLTEEGRLRPTDGAASSSAISELDVPDGVRAVTGKRLARLGPEAAPALAAAAVVGRRFSVGLLEALGMGGDLMLSILDRAEAARIVVADAAGYRFAHELIRQSLIAGLSPTRRQRLHLQVAEAIERTSGADADAHAADIGHHLRAAGDAADPAKTSRYLQVAGDTAYSRRAFHEATLAYRQALDALACQDRSPGREAQELELWSALNRVLQLTSGYAASDTLEAAARARSLAERAGSLSKLIREEVRVWRGVITAGDYAAAAALADHICDLAEGDEPHPGRLVFAHNAQVQTRFYTGDLRGVEEHFARLSPLIDTAGERQAPGNNNVAIGVAGLNAWILGQGTMARERMARAFALAERSQNPYDLAIALHFQGILSSFEGDGVRAEEVAERLLALSEQNGFSYAADLARCTLGWARAQRGQVDQALTLIHGAWTNLEASGARVGITYVLAQMAMIQAEAASLQEALASLDEALSAHPQERVFRPEALRRRGDLQLRLGEPARAAADYQAALALARAMGARAWEQRAEASLEQLKVQDRQAPAAVADQRSPFGQK
jgi:DNA-binding winged helix-turn-helix (wHTH) protein/tetratricopeptide (TPR) repeat protein